MKGDLIDQTTVETDTGEYTVSLRFVDWEMQENRDTRGLAVPRYSIRIETPDGEAESFTAHGSIHEAEEQQPGLNTSALDMADSIARDGLMFYEGCDGITDDLDERLTAEKIQGEFAKMVDRLAEAWQIENPSEAVRAFGKVMQTARDLRDIGLDYHELHDFAEAARAKMNE